jgi:hypothetical protein
VQKQVERLGVRKLKTISRLMELSCGAIRQSKGLPSDQR